jgi:hypothetical protein
LDLIAGLTFLIGLIDVRFKYLEIIKLLRITKYLKETMNVKILEKFSEVVNNTKG